MKTEIKDLSHCPRKGHIVHRSEMTTMLSYDGKQRIRACVTCKNEIIERRLAKHIHKTLDNTK